MFKVNTKFEADSLLYSLSHFECDSHIVHVITQWHLPPPLTSIVKSSLFTHVPSSPLCLAPGYLDVTQTILIMLTMAGLFPDRPHIWNEILWSTNMLQHKWTLKTMLSKNSQSQKTPYLQGLATWEGNNMGVIIYSFIWTFHIWCAWVWYCYVIELHAYDFVIKYFVIKKGHYLCWTLYYDSICNIWSVQNRQIYKGQNIP